MVRPAVDYELHGLTYAQHRRPDPRISRAITSALGQARTVVNVGAGTGSYEPADRWVLAVEPSAVMRAQRPLDAAPAINGRAEELPLDDDAVDAAMACVTIHHWQSAEAGLREMRRVARGPVVVFTFDPSGFVGWQQHHFAEVFAIERPRFPRIDSILEELGGRSAVEVIPTPDDCTDGFVEAFWNRPEALLDPEVRSAQSLWSLLSSPSSRATSAPGPGMRRMVTCAA